MPLTGNVVEFGGPGVQLPPGRACSCRVSGPPGQRPLPSWHAGSGAQIRPCPAVAWALRFAYPLTLPGGLGCARVAFAHSG